MTDDTIYRSAAIDTLNEQIEQCNKALGSFDIALKDEYAIKVERASLKAYREQLENLPSAQPERDIPKKPTETIDRSWGIRRKQAVCPNCDSYLGMVHFISENGKTKVTYCESCGQAIDWEGWEDHEND